MPVTLLVSSVPKIAGFMLAARLLIDGLQNMQSYWQDILVALAVLSLVAARAYSAILRINQYIVSLVKFALKQFDR